MLDEFTQDENGKVVLDEEAAKAKIKSLGGYEKLYRIKLEADYLAKLAFDGAKRIYGDPLSDEVKERLVFELYIMKTMGFPGYFLIVQDFINAARTQLGFSLGPGRGSAAVSAVAYPTGPGPGGPGAGRRPHAAGRPLRHGIGRPPAGPPKALCQGRPRCCRHSGLKTLPKHGTRA